MAKLNKASSNNSLRIIGGIWRGRKLNFPDIDGLRPTGDRVRETVFNWLQPVIGGSRCLDLFAGSGALGFEAASRGASSVTMIEADRLAYRQLQQHQQQLAATQCVLISGKAEAAIMTLTEPFDVVFFDPPYQAELWAPVAQLLMQRELLRHGARIYLEYPRKQTVPELPRSWQLLREKQAGDVTYCLFEYEPGVPE